MSSPVETIVAVSTPPGRGGVGIVRLSGTDARRIAETVCGCRLQPRRARYRHFSDADGEVLDDGVALWFPAPASYSGEDVVELQGHGNPVLLDALVARCCALGARLARPGEFTERAFLNDRLDLAQAESVADLINASTATAARAAARAVQGELSTAVDNLATALTELRVHVESALDFPDEDIDFLAEEPVRRHMSAVVDQATQLLARAEAGARLHEGALVVLAGQPNVGKSSLLNTLASRDVAIVTDVPGTTRDVLRVALDIDGLAVELVDTAGLRDATDAVEREGVRRTREQLAQADAVLLVFDASVGVTDAERELAEDCGDMPLAWIGNKSDLLAVNSEATSATVAVSALHGTGLADVRTTIARLLGHDGAMKDGVVSARRRHVDALENATRLLQLAQTQLFAGMGGELVADDLRNAHASLESITGRFTADDLLGKIFSAFCIGK